MQAKTVVLAPEMSYGLARHHYLMIHLYHQMASFVAKIIRAFTGHAPRTGPSLSGPRILPAYAALARFQTNGVEIEPRLRLLVTQLAAERSRCRWCIEHGRHLWREAQFPLEPLRTLLRYESSGSFSDRERAALRFADAVTRYSEASGGMPIEPLMRARQYLSEPEIAAVTAAAASRHFFNPITGALGADVAPWGAPIGSQLRGLWL
jgi:alkylhydroperoxidase family enzyme